MHIYEISPKYVSVSSKAKQALFFAFCCFVLTTKLIPHPKGGTKKKPNPEAHGQLVP